MTRVCSISGVPCHKADSWSCFSEQVHKQPSVGLTLFPRSLTLPPDHHPTPHKISRSDPSLNQPYDATSHSHHAVFHFRHVPLLPGPLLAASFCLLQDRLQQRLPDQHRSVHPGLDSGSYSRVVSSCRLADLVRLANSDGLTIARRWIISKHTTPAH